MGTMGSRECTATASRSQRGGVFPHRAAAREPSGAKASGPGSCDTTAPLAIVEVVASGTHEREQGRAATVILAVVLLGALTARVAAAERVPTGAAAERTAVRLREAGPQAPDANASLQAADEALERGDHAAAAEGFSASYRALSPAQRQSPVGARTIARAYDAYREAWHRGRDVALLRAAEALLGEHVALLEPVAKPEVVQEARHQLEWIEHLLELEEASARAATPVACPEPPALEAPVCPTVAAEPEPAEPVAADEVDAAPQRRDPVGVALVAAGTVTLTGGVGLLIGGARVLPTARQQIEAAGRDPDDPVPQDAVYLQIHQERGRNVMIAGGVVAGVGAAAAAWGIVRLARRRTGAPDAERAVTVGLAPRGILLRARF